MYNRPSIVCTLIVWTSLNKKENKPNLEPPDHKLLTQCNRLYGIHAHFDSLNMVPNYSIYTVLALKQGCIIIKPHPDLKAQ